MVFRLDDDVDGGFYMRNTPVPAVISWRRTATSCRSPTWSRASDQDGCPTLRAGRPLPRTIEVSGRLATRIPRLDLIGAADAWSTAGRTRE